MSDIEASELGLSYDLLGNFVTVSRSQQIMLATWAAATNIFKHYPAFARLDLAAIEKGCGKTVAMESTLALCPESITVAYTTQSSVKNWIDEYPNSIIGLDERDLLFGTMGRARGASAELVAILNAGYAQNGTVMATRSGKSVIMPVYNAMATAGIGRAYDTLADRSCTIVLKKALPVDTWVSVLHETTMARAGKDVGEWLKSGDAQKVLKRTPVIAPLLGKDRDPRHQLKYAPMYAVAVVGGFADQWLEAELEIFTGLSASPLPSRAEMLLTALTAALPGMRVTSDEIRSAGIQGFDFMPGRIGDIEIAGLLRQVGVETQTSNGVRGYQIPENTEHRTQNTGVSA
jgi:hypothetical protein